MEYRTIANKKIEAVILGEPIHSYPLWFHNAVMDKRIEVISEYSETKKSNIVSKVKVRNIYGGLDIGLNNKDYICKGVAQEIFVCRKAIFEFLYTQNKNK